MTAALRLVRCENRRARCLLRREEGEQGVGQGTGPGAGKEGGERNQRAILKERENPRVKANLSSLRFKLQRALSVGKREGRIDRTKGGEKPQAKGIAREPLISVPSASRRLFTQSSGFSSQKRGRDKGKESRGREKAMGR